MKHEVIHKEVVRETVLPPEQIVVERVVHVAQPDINPYHPIKFKEGSIIEAMRDLIRERPQTLMAGMFAAYLRSHGIEP